jgi:hypothetical protein
MIVAGGADKVDLIEESILSRCGSVEMMEAVKLGEKLSVKGTWEYVSWRWLGGRLSELPESQSRSREGEAKAR